MLLLIYVLLLVCGPLTRREATGEFGGSPPHVSKTTRGICTNRIFPSGYHCISWWHILHSTAEHGCIKHRRF